MYVIGFISSSLKFSHTRSHSKEWGQVIKFCENVGVQDCMVAFSSAPENCKQIKLQSVSMIITRCL